ncbi:MAG: hypothetical protein KGY76_06305 [Candidatus Thermoplasmatota archaeon]|nr:hypothetical protein [Candidatus Thermoplasmatota archaeon]
MLLISGSAASFDVGGTDPGPKKDGETAETEMRGEGKNYSIKSLFDRDELGDDYPYDIDTIKNMTLEDLNWTVEDIDGDGEAKYEISHWLLGSANVVEGSFGGEDSLGGANYTMLPREALMNGSMDKRKTVHLEHAAAFIYPDGYPDVGGNGYGAFMNVHGVPSIKDSSLKKIVLKAVNRYDMPMMLAGEFSQNWESLNFTGQDEITFPSMLPVTLAEEMTTEILKMNYIYPLLRMNLMAHTLFERLAEDMGGDLSKGIFSEGTSKQGYSRWFVAMLDDRVKVAQCDWIQIQDLLHSTKRYYWDWGRPPIKNNTGWAKYSDEIASLMIPIGEALQIGAKVPSNPQSVAYQVWGIPNQLDLIDDGTMVSISGSCGRGAFNGDGEYELDHDGTYFPTGSETVFLDKLTEAGVNWRYGRDLTNFMYTGGPEAHHSRWIENCFGGMDYMTGRLDQWIKIKDVSSNISGKDNQTDYLNLTATLDEYENHVGDIKHVRAYYAPNSDRRWNDPEHAEGRSYEWRSVDMDKLNDSTYQTSLEIDNDMMYGYWVEVKIPGHFQWFVGYWEIYDASPIRLVNEYEREATGGSDLEVSSIKKTSEEIREGEDEPVEVGIEVNRTDIYYQYDYVAPPLRNISCELWIDGQREDSKELTIHGDRNVTLMWEDPKPGERQLWVKINPNRIIPEYDDTNNRLNRTFRVSHRMDLPYKEESDGWLFISLPYQISDNSISKILKDIDGSYEKVMFYDSEEDGWDSYIPGRTKKFNDLGSLNNKISFWIRMKKDDSLFFNASLNEGEETTISLEPGWNMVGYPSNKTRSGKETLPDEVSKVGVFDESRKNKIEYIRDLSSLTMRGEEGYWVYNSAGKTIEWTIEY